MGAVVAVPHAKAGWSPTLPAFPGSLAASQRNVWLRDLVNKLYAPGLLWVLSLSLPDPVAQLGPGTAGIPLFVHSF